jgi:hypothetical protein
MRPVPTTTWVTGSATMTATVLQVPSIEGGALWPPCLRSHPADADLKAYNRMRLAGSRGGESGWGSHGQKRRGGFS